VNLSAKAKKNVLPRWLGPNAACHPKDGPREHGKDKRPKAAAIDAVTEWAKVRARWDAYGGCFRDGLGQATPELAELVRAVDASFAAATIPTDARVLGALLSILQLRADGYGARLHDELLAATAANVGPALTMEAWLHAHAWSFAFDTTFYQPGVSRAAWLYFSPQPVHLIANEAYELSAWTLIRRLLSVASPSEQAKALEAVERLTTTLPATPEAPDVRTSWEVAVAFAVPARPDLARALAPRVLEAWARPKSTSALQPLDGTGIGLLASLDDAAVARSIVDGALALYSTSARELQLYAETLVDRFGEDAFGLLTPIIEKLGWKKNRFSQGFDDALKRTTEALTAIEGDAVTTYLLEHFAAASAGPAGKLVRSRLERTKDATLRLSAAAPSSGALALFVASLRGDAPAALAAPPPPLVAWVPTSPPSSVAALLALVRPPARRTPPPPIPEGAPRLPADHLALLDAYGLGSFVDFLTIHPPAWVATEGATWSASERGLHAAHPAAYPFPFYPDPGGLLVFGTTDNGDRLYYRTEGEPDAWQVVLWESRGDEHLVIEGGVTTFLREWLTRELEVTVFPDPLSPWSDDEGDALTHPWFSPAGPRDQRARVLATEKKLAPFAKRLAALRATLGAMPIAGSTPGRTAHVKTDRDWLVTLADDDESTTLTVQFPREDAEWVDGEMARVAAAMGMSVVA
jgi:hypothetical protein